MQQLDLFPAVYTNSSDKFTLTTKMPSIIFGNGISESLIHTVLRAMTRGQIRVKDYQGNELKVVMY